MAKKTELQKLLDVAEQSPAPRGLVKRAKYYSMLNKLRAAVAQEIVLQTPATYDVFKHFAEMPVGRSLTVPDESLSIRQLMERFTTGQPTTDVARDAVWVENQNFDSDDIEKWANLDLVDREKISRRIQADIERFESELKEEEEKRKKAAEESAGKAFSDAVAEAVKNAAAKAEPNASANAK